MNLIMLCSLFRLDFIPFVDLRFDVSSFPLLRTFLPSISFVAGDDNVVNDQENNK